MPRKPNFKKRPSKVDPKFGSANVGTFINRMMMSGKKSLSERLFYTALDIIATKVKDKKPVEVFEAAVANVAPVVKVKARRIGGATYQVPEPVDKLKGIAIAHRWIIQTARKRAGKSFSQKLSNELMDAAENKGKAIDLKESTHRMAEANKAFAHYARN